MKNKLVTGVAFYYDFYRSCLVEYCVDRSNQKIEAVGQETGGVTSFSSRTVGDVIVQISKIQEITAYTIDEAANFLIGLNKDEYLTQKHPHLTSFLPNNKELELLEEDSQADHDLLLAMRKKSNFRLTDYVDKPIVNKALILLAKHIKPWFFTSVKAKPSFYATTIPSWQSQQLPQPWDLYWE